MQDGGSSLWTTSLLALSLIYLATLLAYVPSFTGEFVYDDRGEILLNPSMRDLGSVSDMMFKSYRLPPRPLPYLSFGLNYAANGENPFGYHCVNFGIHLLISTLLYFLVRQVGAESVGMERASLIAFASCLLWSLHPLGTNCVTYIYQRMEQMVSLFQIAVLFFLWQSKTSRFPTVFLGLSWMACLVGMLTKENMIIAPLLATWFDRVFLSSSWQEVFKKRGFYHLFLWISITILIAWVWHNANAYPELRANEQQDNRHTPIQHLVSQPRAILSYIWLVFFPVGLSIERDWGVASNPATWVPLGLVVLVLLAATTYLIVTRPRIGFIAGVFFLTLAPSSSLVPAIQTMSEHRTYLPLFCVLLLACLALTKVAWRFGPAKLLVGSLALGITFGALTWNRNLDFQDFGVLWKKAFALSGDRLSATLCDHVVKALLERARSQKVASESAAVSDPTTRKLYEEAHEIASLIYKKHRAPFTARNRASTHLELREFDQAILYFEEALAGNPRDSEALSGLAKAYERSGDIPRAMACYERLSVVAPDNSEGWANLARLVARHEPLASLDYFDRALRLDPNNADVISNRCIALVDLERYDEAVTELRRASRIDPKHRNVRRNLEMLERIMEQRRNPGN